MQLQMPDAFLLRPHVNHLSFMANTTFWNMTRRRACLQNQGITSRVKGCLLFLLERTNGFRNNVRIKSPEAETAEEVIDTFDALNFSMQ